MAFKALARRGRRLIPALVLVWCAGALLGCGDGTPVEAPDVREADTSPPDPDTLPPPADTDFLPVEDVHDSERDTSPEDNSQQDLEEPEDIAPDLRDAEIEEELVAPCSPNPCEKANQTVCVPVDDGAGPGYRCDCDAGYVPDGEEGCVPEIEVCVVDADCDDGVFCNGVERCLPDDPEADEWGCVPGEPLSLDDNDPCTIGYCDEEAREVVHEPISCGNNMHCVDGECRCNPGYTVGPLGNCVNTAYECQPDPAEPNSTPATAKRLREHRRKGLTAVAGYPDWFYWDACAGGELWTTVYFWSGLHDATLQATVWDETATVALWQAQGIEGDQEIRLSVEDDGRYYLEIIIDSGYCTVYSYDTANTANCPPPD